MQRRLLFIISISVFLLTLHSATAQQIEYLDAKPMSQMVRVQVQPVKTSKTISVPLITWGGDVATILANTDGIFQQEGLDVTLFREDNFAKQVEKCLSGETPYLRGTMGMINAAADACNAKGVDLVVIYQMTWSTGGDAIVVRPKKNLKNVKTVAIQLYGPHMDYAANLFMRKGRLGKIDFKWLTELTLPPYDTRGKIIDPVSAFQSDNSLHSAMCIIPDALMLTSGGTKGTGAEGSVKGSTILLSTKTASRVIADVYAVRKDYFDRNRSKVQSFVHALMRGEEALRDLVKNKSSMQAKYKQLISESADVLLGAPQATADVEALLGDCEYVGYSGNIAFFTGKGTTRSLKTLTSEIQKSFIQMGLMTGKVTLASANWDYGALARGLKGATNIPVQRKKFDTKKVAASVQKKILVEPTTWEEEGTLFIVEINFSPNQSDFPSADYTGDFQKALEISQTYGGSLIIIEGHSDPLGILKAEKRKERKQVITQMKQQAKNLSYNRAMAVRKSFLSFCGKHKINIDESQFVAVGLGTVSPKYSPPRTENEWNANRRVVFRIKEVEAELAKFSPLD
ncbi:MAG: nitrate ABC transporter substrate-binding protein [Calditrichaeota bacterium]|nr:nitrate ABC transporter substrate-binding protein [Calditrichota bacterium]